MLLFSSAYNEYTVISKEYTGPLDFCKNNQKITKIIFNFLIFSIN